ncbi:MAG: hypothetical protein KIS92_04400 [Planctomycetota bacterium]|nr:hypothetical protein [Planctomycetota bacterium]
MLKVKFYLLHVFRSGCGCEFLTSNQQDLTVGAPYLSKNLCKRVGLEWRPQGDSNLFARPPTIVNVYTNKDLRRPCGLDGHQVGLMAGEYLKHLLDLPPDTAIAEHVACIERLKAAARPVPEAQP